MGVTEVPGARSAKEAFANLAGAFSDLPMANTVPLPLPVLPDEVDLWDAAEFADAMAVWISTYDGLVTQVRTTAADMARELTELRTQRKAVRELLGISELLGGQQ